MTPAPDETLEALVAHYLKLVEYDTEWFVPFEVIELLMDEPQANEIFNALYDWLDEANLNPTPRPGA